MKRRQKGASSDEDMIRSTKRIGALATQYFALVRAGKSLPK